VSLRESLSRLLLRKLISARSYSAGYHLFGNRAKDKRRKKRLSGRLEQYPVAKMFNISDHVRWNSEAGRVSGVITKKITCNAKLKGYVRHASKEAPQSLRAIRPTTSQSIRERPST
jgi:hypothetical protein